MHINKQQALLGAALSAAAVGLSAIVLPWWVLIGLNVIGAVTTTAMLWDMSAAAEDPKYTPFQWMEDLDADRRP